MRIAILGSTSAIALDMAARFLNDSNYEIFLFGRNKTTNIHDFKKNNYDVIINFIGRGSPTAVRKMGQEILEVTAKYDDMVLKYLNTHENTKYIFFSSGAAYGGNFDEPANKSTRATVPINATSLVWDWYSIAKMLAECKHRASPHAIVDIRVFNYFSQMQNLYDGYMMTEIIRSIKQDTVFNLSTTPIVRDWISPDDLFQLLEAIICADYTNMAVDCYSSAPLSSIALANSMTSKFGLRTHKTDMPTGKINYYSTNHAAEEFGYTPTKNSLETLTETCKIIFDTVGSMP